MPCESNSVGTVTSKNYFKSPLIKAVTSSLHWNSSLYRVWLPFACVCTWTWLGKHHPPFNGIISWTPQSMHSLINNAGSKETVQKVSSVLWNFPFNNMTKPQSSFPVCLMKNRKTYTKCENNRHPFHGNRIKNHKNVLK